MPDPRHGVFETLLVIDGGPVEMEAHLSRLTSSLDELFPELVRPDLSQMDTQLESGAMRIVVVPGTGRFETKVSFRETEERLGPVALHSFEVTGGLGRHKWADRSLLDEAQAGLPADAVPLVLDEDGSVLEASRANVFAVLDGALVTPPADGRILPGVTRMRVIELSSAMGIDVGERELSRDDLLGAEGVFLTGSVRGVEPVCALDGIALTNGGDLIARIAAELRQAWLGAQVG